MEEIKDNQYSDDTFLARWLEGDLTPQEKIGFEKSEEYIDYKKIIETADKLKISSYDKEKNFENILQDTERNPKVIKLIPNWMYGAVASVLVLIGVFYFFNNTVTEHVTGYGEQLSVVLPDGSEVKLNSKSEINFKESNWNQNRTVTLSGEAFFKVKKGSDFTVITDQGKVQVLGTQFNVNTQDSFFEVVCHEGKVRAISDYNNSEVILTRGKAYRVVPNKTKNWDTEMDIPSWLTGETTFTNTPLEQVIKALENQFNISFEKKNIDQNLRFTGSFTHKEISVALKTIFVPMEISYTFKSENTIVLAKE